MSADLIAALYPLIVYSAGVIYFSLSANGHRKKTMRALEACAMLIDEAKKFEPVMIAISENYRECPTEVQEAFGDTLKTMSALDKKIQEALKAI